MKKNRMMRLASVLLVLCLLTTSVISGTFAKYTSSVSGEATATVAKWSIEVNDTEIATTGTPTVTFDLFDTATNYDEAGDDVVDGKIAPGTKGSFSFKVENTSEVSAKYTITFGATFPTGITGDRFKFYSDAAMANEISVVDGKYTAANGVEIEVGDTEADTVTVYWQWTFGDNVDDSAIGIAAQNGTTVVTITPTIDVEQVD